MRDLIVHLIDDHENINLGEMLLKDALRDIFETDKKKSYVIKFKTMRNTEFKISIFCIDENRWQTNITDLFAAFGIAALIAEINLYHGVKVYTDTNFFDGLSYTQVIFIAAVVEEMQRQGK